MSQDIIAKVEAKYMKPEKPKCDIGDTVNVHLRIIEGEKERIQVFNGVVIARNGVGINQSITVRRIVANEGVERVIPLHSPKVSKIEVVRGGHVRRSKLYYLRERVGKKRRLRDRRRGLQSAVALEPQKTPPAEEMPQPPETEGPVEQELETTEKAE
mgnify:CR=1 FL=1